MKGSKIVEIISAFLIPISAVVTGYFCYNNGDIKGFFIVCGVLAFASLLAVMLFRHLNKKPES